MLYVYASCQRAKAKLASAAVAKHDLECLYQEHQTQHGRRAIFSYDKKMWQYDCDVPPCQFVFDLEWLGNSLIPRTTHVTQIGAVHVESNETFQKHVRPMASQKAFEHKCKKMGMSSNLQAHYTTAIPLNVALQQFVEWISKFTSNEPVVLIAHNGVRYDAPVLLNAFMYCGMTVPQNLHILDSLHHVRYFLRHQAQLKGFSLDNLAHYYQVKFDTQYRHEAVNDALLLLLLLQKTQEQCKCPFITGMPNILPNISAMVVRGIGPIVCQALNNIDLCSMCNAILQTYGDLTSESCAKYLHNCNLKEKVPLVAIPLIASAIMDASKRYLQYIE